MELRYNRRAGTAYLTLSARKPPLQNATLRPPGSRAADDYLVFDFDSAGHLVGIEFLVPENQLAPEVLAAAAERE